MDHFNPVGGGDLYKLPTRAWQCLITVPRLKSTWEGCGGCQDFQKIWNDDCFLRSQKSSFYYKIAGGNTNWSRKNAFSFKKVTSVDKFEKTSLGERRNEAHEWQWCEWNALNTVLIVFVTCVFRGTHQAVTKQDFLVEITVVLALPLKGWIDGPKLPKSGIILSKWRLVDNVHHEPGLFYFNSFANLQCKTNLDLNDWKWLFQRWKGK